MHDLQHALENLSNVIMVYYYFQTSPNHGHFIRFKA